VVVVPATRSVPTALDHLPLPPVPGGAHGMTAPVELPPGGDVVHHQAGNASADGWSRFVVVMPHVPGAPMPTLVEPAELAERRHRPAGG